MSVPNPSTTEWVPLQGNVSTGGMAYWGEWESSRVYNDGDIVIGEDGIAYLCTKQGVTVEPKPWPGAAGPQGAKGDRGDDGIDGATGPQGVGIPMPVVNGKFIKGVGGAAVWADTPNELPTPQNGLWLTASGGAPVWAALPPYPVVDNSTGALSGIAGRLGVGCVQVPGNDWNNAVDNGWYMASGAANAPDGNWFTGMVVVHNNAWIYQTVWLFTSNPPPRYQRGKYNGAWAGWSAW